MRIQRSPCHNISPTKMHSMQDLADHSPKDERLEAFAQRLERLEAVVAQLRAEGGNRKFFDQARQRTSPLNNAQ